jgi:ribosomal-protein-alanine N-acetyltransferase
MTVPPSVKIRDMQLSDLESVVAVEQLSNPHPWSSGQFLSEFDNRCSVIDLLCLGEEITAFLCSWQVVDELHIQNVATHPDFRRRGLAAYLLTHRISQAKTAGVVVSLLEVRAQNRGAITLYEQLGYRQNGLRVGYYNDGEDAILMESDLTA